MSELAKHKFVFTLVGASGAVGKEMLSILEDRAFPIQELRLVGSERSLGKKIEFRGQEIPVKKLAPDVFTGANIAFFTAGAEVSREFVPIAARAGAVVLDNTSAFRMEEDVPLAVPEVNPECLQEIPSRRIISIPNCSTIQLVMALAPIHRKANIRRIVVSTYQSTSGAGRRAMEELSRQVTDLFNYRESEPDVFPHRIAFNVIPQIGPFQGGGQTGEEEKICAETKKILGDSSIGVSVTAVRVPTFHSHGESVNIETAKPISPEEVRSLLSESPGILVVDDGNNEVYPMPIDAEKTDEVLVGRIRSDSSREDCLNLWVVADNLRKGAALNGVQILEYLLSRNLLG